MTAKVIPFPKKPKRLLWGFSCGGDAETRKKFQQAWDELKRKTDKKKEDE